MLYYKRIMDNIEDSVGESNNLNSIIVDEGNNKGNGKMQGNKGKKSNAKGLLLDEHKFKEFLPKITTQQLSTEIEDEEELVKFIKENIAPLNNKHVVVFTALLRESLEKERKFAQSDLQELQHSINVYSRINRMFKESGVNSPILIATYYQFQPFWSKKMEQVPLKQAKQMLLKLWREVPYQIFKPYLQNFKLTQLFCSIPPEEVIKILSNDLFEGKIQQTVQYYNLYSNNAKNRELIEQFQQQQLIPRLTKKDQLFTEYVLNLIRNNKNIGIKICKSIDINQEEKLMNLVGDDHSNHLRVVERATRRHYRDIVGKNKVWYIVEDKLSYSSKFLKWYAQQLINGRIHRQSQSEGQYQKSIQMDLSHQQIVRIAKSINARISKNDQQEFVKNPLYELDDFCPAQLILQKLQPTKGNYKEQDFLPLNKNNVHFIDSINHLFVQAEEDILANTVVGFDSQFIPTENKFVQGGVSIIQISTSTHCYIFDYQHLRSQSKFIDFFLNLMQNAQITKVGHTFSSDLQYLNKNFPKKLAPEGLVDISKLFKEQFPQQLYSSLAYMTHKFMGKQLCKYEQRSNWARRPLKKTQMYYAALDAVVCLSIYRKMVKNGINKKQVAIAAKSNSKQQEKGIHEFDMTKFEQYTKNPIFLVDNMLKKLCSTMRNCGIDAQYISIRDHELIESQGRKQRRIIVTRDTKLAQRKGHKTAIYLLNQKSDTDLMFQELLTAFSIDLSKYKSLSRCVKCNGEEIIIISSEQALKEVNFMYETKIETFWRCAKCRQIYWEGGQFAKAKNKFDALKK